ncbi:MAG: hypothetical protein ACJ74X_07920 [Gaiellaceae bacterium]
MAARRRELVVLALLAGLALPTTAIGDGIVSVDPPAARPGSTVVVAFRAPNDQYDEFDGVEHDDYVMSLRGPGAACMRNAFPDAGGGSLVEAGPERFGVVLINGRVTVLKYGGTTSGHQIERGDQVSVRLRAPACGGTYEGAIAFVESSGEGPDIRHRVGSFRFIVSASGILPPTGGNGLTGLLGLTLLIAGLALRAASTGGRFARAWNHSAAR